MTKEQRLKSEARQTTEFRGHKMEKPWVSSSFYGCKRQSIKCKDCGMHVIIDLQPAVNDIDIGGQAVALYCLGKE